MKEHIREAFIRQRRNLMIVSLVLLFTEVAGVTITEVNVFGTKLTVSNPAAVNYALWGGYFYWLWRYYVYFHDLDDKGFLAAYWGRMSERVAQLAFRQLLQNAQFIERAHGRKAVLGKPAACSFQSSFRFVANIIVFFTEADQTNIRPVPEVVNFNDIEVTARVPLLISHARAWMYVLTRTHLPSEYLLPYLVAAAPVVYAATPVLIAAMKRAT